MYSQNLLNEKKNLHMMMQLQNWQRVLSNFAPIFLNWSCLALARKRPAHLAGIRKLVYTHYTTHTHTHASHHCYEPVRLPAKQYNRPILSLYSKYWDWNLTYTHRLPPSPPPLHPPFTPLPPPPSPPTNTLLKGTHAVHCFSVVLCKLCQGKERVSVCVW